MLVKLNLAKDKYKGPTQTIPLPKGNTTSVLNLVFTSQSCGSNKKGGDYLTGILRNNNQIVGCNRASIHVCMKYPPL